MTYKVFGGTLNLTLSIYLSTSRDKVCVIVIVINHQVYQMNEEQDHVAAGCRTLLTNLGR